MDTYTQTTWRVKEGREEDFLERWRDWAEWSRRHGFADAALLLRDTEAERTYISYGRWADRGAVQSWRQMAGYQQRLSALSEVLDGFEPRTLQVVFRR
jgi:heme-degrading monooxygenase HmoA